MNKNTNISNYKNLYFIGIGGIGMSALARYFSVNGKKVAGYDKVASVITKNLEKSGIAIHYNDDIGAVSESFLNKEDTLIVYTPAIPNTHNELNYFKNKEFKLLKRAAVLGLITNTTFSFAIAGTHGKTTTSTLLGHILKEAVDATSFLGGIATNYNSNLILGNAEVSVVEADEYDRSFLYLNPNYACVTTMDADHLDIYGAQNALENAFIEFADKVTEKLFYKYGLAQSLASAKATKFSYGFEDEADYQAKRIRTENSKSVFDVKTPSNYIEDVVVCLLGNHNVLNTLAAIAMADAYGVSIDTLRNSLANFKGIERRFNLKINTPELVLIDDYAHHPTEINAVFETINQLYPTMKKTVIFQPHLFSRTKDFFTEFVVALNQFDKVVLLDIYPARELPIAGITASKMCDEINNLIPDKCVLSTKKNIIKNTNTNQGVVAVLGAGDIGVEVKEIVQQINKEQVA